MIKPRQIYRYKLADYVVLGRAMVKHPDGGWDHGFAYIKRGGPLQGQVYVRDQDDFLAKFVKQDGRVGLLEWLRLLAKRW